MRVSYFQARQFEKLIERIPKAKPFIISRYQGINHGIYHRFSDKQVLSNILTETRKYVRVSQEETEQILFHLKQKYKPQ